MSWYADVYFQMVFVVVISVTLWRLIVTGKKVVQQELDYQVKPYIGIGVATGLISAFSGLGGGVAMIPLLTLLLKQDMKKAAGISIGVIPVMILPMLVVYAFQAPDHQFLGRNWLPPVSHCIARSDRYFYWVAAWCFYCQKD